MISAFLSTGNRNREYLAIRFIARDGTLAGAVTKQAGVQSQDVTLYQGAFSDDPDFHSVLESEAGEILVGPFSLQTDEQGLVLDPPVQLLSLYTPVPGFQSADQILGAIQLDILAQPLLDIAGLQTDELSGFSDEHRALLLNNDLQVIVDSQAADDAFYAELRAYLSGFGVDAHQRGMGDKIVSTRKMLPGGGDIAWNLVFVTEAAQVYGPVNRDSAVILVVMLGIAFAAIQVISRTADSRWPLAKANEMAQRLAAEQAAGRRAGQQASDEGFQLVWRLISSPAD
jgi:hypothetical protein